MNPERWTNIETICDQAMNLHADERSAFLARACAGDRVLHAEVQSLLDQMEKEPEFLKQPLVHFSDDGVFSDREPSSLFIGPYRIIRTIAAGGMGEVYLAAREDDTFSRSAAVKVIRRGLDTEEVLSRFYAERQILASLNHPHIARLFDGGATDEGLPWFAMEYIEGVPITEYCERSRAPLPVRLGFFLKVCSAVQYAHRNLVVHRDLKPGNILVTPDGQPKLLDFGIAKILAQETNANQTLTQHRMMTPEYASPEQIRGEWVSTSSDVYSLGVLLYELLTGNLPYKWEKKSVGALEQAICEQEPERPSSAAVKRGNSPRRLAGDLDNILLMALQKDPAKRYSSAEQFADDIRRHLEGKPVIARADTLWYRGRKFIRRHRWSVGATTAVAVLIVLFGVVTMIQSAAIKQGALQVERERDRAEHISKFLIDLFQSADPTRARDASITARELIRRGAERAETQLSDQPDLQSELFLVISQVYERLGLYGEAEHAAQRALDVRMGIHGERHPDVAAALNSLGWLYYQQGDLTRGDSLLQETLRMRRELLGPRDLAVARTLNDLAVVKQARGDYAATDTLLAEALAIRRSMLGNEHEAVAVTLNNYAALRWTVGDLDDAVALMREALATFEVSVGDDDPRTANVMINLASLLNRMGSHEEAEPLYRRSLAIRQKIVGEEHPEVAITLVHLGSLLRNRGEYEEAGALLGKALAMSRKLLGEDHYWVAQCRQALALLHDRSEEYERAEEQYREALRVFRRILPGGHDQTAELLHLMGDFYLRTDRPQSAEPLLREALGIRTSRFGENDPRTLQTKTLLEAAVGPLAGMQ